MPREDISMNKVNIPQIGDFREYRQIVAPHKTDYRIQASLLFPFRVIFLVPI